jgi:hypothetical protein
MFQTFAYDFAAEINDCSDAPDDNWSAEWAPSRLCKELPSRESDKTTGVDHTPRRARSPFSIEMQEACVDLKIGQPPSPKLPQIPTEQSGVRDRPARRDHGSAPVRPVKDSPFAYLAIRAAECDSSSLGVSPFSRHRREEGVEPLWEFGQPLLPMAPKVPLTPKSKSPKSPKSPLSPSTLLSTSAEDTDWRFASSIYGPPAGKPRQRPRRS